MNDPSLESRVIALEQRLKAMEKIWITKFPSRMEARLPGQIYGLYPHPLTDPLHETQTVHSNHKQVNVNANDK